MTENSNEKNRLRILENEFARVANIIEAYVNRQLNFMNFSIIIIGGSFVYLHEKDMLIEYLQYYPYFLFLVYGLWAVEFQRINVYNGYMSYIENEINIRLSENILHSRRITKEYISNWKKNGLYTLYTTLWLVVFIALYFFSHKDTNFMNINAIIQLFIMGTFTIIYIQIPSKLPNAVKELCTNNKNIVDETTGNRVDGLD